MRTEELNDQTERMVKSACSESFCCVFPRNLLGSTVFISEETKTKFEKRNFS